MRTGGIESAVAPVVDAFDALGVPYSIVGSVASSSHGVPRSTIDIDLVANLRLPQVESLVAALIDAYYIDGDAARDAVRRRSMFNVIHLDTMLKIDVYVLTERDFDQESFGRRSWRCSPRPRAVACTFWIRPKTPSSTSSSGIGWAARSHPANGQTPWVF